MCPDTCDQVYFKLGTMLHTTKFYGLIPVWMTLRFTQGHRITWKLELAQSFCCKVAWSNPNVMVDYAWQVKKSCENGEYGLFEHWLFIFLILCVCVMKRGWISELWTLVMIEGSDVLCWNFSLAVLKCSFCHAMSVAQRLEMIDEWG